MRRALRAHDEQARPRRVVVRVEREVAAAATPSTSVFRDKYDGAGWELAQALMTPERDARITAEKALECRYLAAAVEDAKKGAVAR